MAADNAPPRPRWSAALLVVGLAVWGCGTPSNGDAGAGGHSPTDSRSTPDGSTTIDANGSSETRGTSADARVDTSDLDAASDGALGSGCATQVDIGFSDTATLKATSFANASIAPYTICTTQNPNYGQAFALDGTPCMKFFWTEVGYDGTRQDRGAEACSALAIYKEGWYGLKFYLPDPGFPSDKTETIAQIFANGGCSSWAAMVEVRNNDLWIVYRGNCVATPQYQVMLAADIRRNVWNPVILHFIASNQNAGGIEVWYADAVCTHDRPTHRHLGINFGFGTWTSDALDAVPSNSIGLKFGMYNFDDANYTTGETRTIFYDDVSQLDGASPTGWEMVNPGR
jgi:hypothetical protein